MTGNRLIMSLPGGGSYTYQYPSTWGDGAWLLSKNDPGSVAWQINSLTDDQGRRIDINSIASETLGCDAVGNLKGLRSNQTFTTGGNPQLLAYQQSNYVYDGAIPNAAGQFNSHRWLTQIQHTYSAYNPATGWQTKLLVGNTYTQDANGQRTSNTISSLDPVSSNPTSRTEQYGYDELNRLTSVNYGDGQTQGYTFDSMGNRLTKTDSSTSNESYTVNTANMLTSRTVGGTNSSYTNDANGNTLTGGGRTNTWDSSNRLVKCVNGTNTSTFVYGSDGVRHRSTVNNVSTDFVLDTSMFVRALYNGNLKATYFMGASGPAYRRDDANGGTVRWYLYDGLGSVLGEVDPNGNITARRKYDVYGMTRAGSDAGTSQHKFVGKLGHPSEDETGLIYMRARYYDPQVGRFSSEDPARNGINHFCYCSNNPVNRIDADGRLDIAPIDPEVPLTGPQLPMYTLFMYLYTECGVDYWPAVLIVRQLGPGCRAVLQALAAQGVDGARKGGLAGMSALAICTALAIATVIGAIIGWQLCQWAAANDSSDSGASDDEKLYTHGTTPRG